MRIRIEIGEKVNYLLRGICDIEADVFFLGRPLLRGLEQQTPHLVVGSAEEVLHCNHQTSKDLSLCA